MYEYDGIKINYTDVNTECKQVIVALHGWGQNIEMMNLLVGSLSNNYRIVIIDLPGHGNSDEPKYSYELNDFIKFLESFFKDKKINNPILIGHSFGGKLSLLYASRNKVNKLILLAPPYKKSSKKVSLRLRILKRISFLPGVKTIIKYVKNKIGSPDYKNASEIMRGVLVKHVNTDITEDVKKITCPTLIVWGDKDLAVPVTTAYELEKLIKDSGVVIYKNSTHYAYLENKINLIKVIRIFLSSK